MTVAIRYGYPAKGREDAEALAHALRASDPTAIRSWDAIGEKARGLWREDAERFLASDWLARHDAALIEQARAEGKAEADAAWAAKVELILTRESAANMDDRSQHLVGLIHAALIPADAATALDQVRAQAKAEDDMRQARIYVAHELVTQDLRAKYGDDVADYAYESLREHVAGAL